MRLCEGLENAALMHLGTPADHPIPEQARLALQRQVDALLGAVATARPQTAERRAAEPAATTAAHDVDWIKPRSVWLVGSPERAEMVEALCGQLRYFGFLVSMLPWGGELPSDDMPLAVLFVPGNGPIGEAEFERASLCARAARPASCSTWGGVRHRAHCQFDAGGVDVAIPSDEQASRVLDRIWTRCCMLSRKSIAYWWWKTRGWRWR